MRLNLYRRHSRCKSKYPDQSFTTQAEERKARKAGREVCDCAIHISGVLATKFDRKSTKQTDWDQAYAVGERWEAHGSWEGLPPRLALEPTVIPHSGPSEIETAAAAFLARYDNGESRPNTHKKYKEVIGKVRAWARDRGLTRLAQFTKLEAEGMRASWKVGPTTKTNQISTVKTFFKYCVGHAGLTTGNPMDNIDAGPNTVAKRTRNKKTQKYGFTDAEITLMCGTARTLYGKQLFDRGDIQLDASKMFRVWTGEDLIDFIKVSIYTGLRISDIVTFHASRLRPDGTVFLRTIKNEEDVCLPLPTEIKLIIARRAIDVGPYIFGTHTTEDLNVITDLWRRKLKNLWELCDPWRKEPAPPGAKKKWRYVHANVLDPTPHRFRHTFARIQLDAGLSIPRLARLLGDSVKTTDSYYAAWSKGQQERNDAELRVALKNVEAHLNQMTPGLSVN